MIQLPVDSRCSLSAVSLESIRADLTVLPAMQGNFVIVVPFVVLLRCLVELFCIAFIALASTFVTHFLLYGMSCLKVFCLLDTLCCLNCFLCFVIHLESQQDNEMKPIK